MSKARKRFVCGGVSASVWQREREADGGTFVAESVTFSRRYRRSNGTWSTARSFGKNDLPRLAVVCQKAYVFLNERDEEGQPCREDERKTSQDG